MDARREELPRFIGPMLASSGVAPTGDGWAMEVKWDGIRAQLRYDARWICVRSRSGRNCTGEFTELAELRDILAGCKVILDGELVSLSADGKPDFATLRRRLAGHSRRAHGPPCGQLAFMAFDGRISTAGPSASSRTGAGASCSRSWSSKALYYGRRGTSSERGRRFSRRLPSRASRAWWPSGSMPRTRRDDVATRGRSRSTDGASGLSSRAGASATATWRSSSLLGGLGGRCNRPAAPASALIESAANSYSRPSRSGS